MPASFQDPRRPADGTTTFLAPVGKGLAFEGDKPTKIADFTDGTSNTILPVLANDDRAEIFLPLMITFHPAFAVDTVSPFASKVTACHSPWRLSSSLSA
ncbi:MAG TPA: hypothetical protein VGY55_13525 [Pirellulales bacterium]|nr:hypothetical protein [Pirellulales bacterium]